MLEKEQLERTVKNLTCEVEDLSIRNSILYEDLKTKSFFDKYNLTLKELNKIKEQYELLIDTKFYEIENRETKNRIDNSYSLSSNLMNDVIIHSNNFDISSPEAKENLK